MENKEYYVLLYYCYTKIEQPELYREEHHALCLKYNLLGRIIIAPEGLNGTVSGLKDDCRAYMQTIKEDSRFKTIEFKVDEGTEHAFQKLNVRVKPEIVHSSLRDIDPTQKTGTYVEPNELQQLLTNEDVVMVDMRSNYEHKLGHFKNAVTLDIDNFRELPQNLAKLKALKDKKIITYCTGGIKCEKGSAYLLEQGFDNVYQLHGGIIKYGLETDGKDFDGKCYVFDNRVAVEINTANPSVVSECYVCGVKSDHMVNCANAKCNRHVPICESCMEEMEGCCSHECQESPYKRPWNMQGYYSKELNGYNPFKDSKRLHRTESNWPIIKSQR